MPVPRVELLWWRGCPSWERVLSDLTEAMRELGFDPGTIERREVETEADAEREGFPGSPTIRIDGVDVQPAVPGAPSGLVCRVYRRRDGRLSPLPDPADVREALSGSTSHSQIAR